MASTMNRAQRRAEAARARKQPELRDTTRDDAIRHAFAYLANVADVTATGATINHPDGTETHVSADDARALYGSTPGVAQ